MKRIYFVAFLAMGLLLGGCSLLGDNGDAVEVAKSQLSVGLPIGISRIAIDDEGRASWTEGDTFALWAENRTGVFNLSGAKFLMMYYWHSLQSAVFTSNANALADGEYTYYAVAPMPEGFTNNTATFTIPASQQGDSFNGAYDIMVAEPVQAEALSADKVNNLALDFHHKMHTLKVNIAKNNLGCDISQLRFTFPSNVTGVATVDIANPEAQINVVNGSKELVVNCANATNDGDVVWGVIFPQTISSAVKLVAVGVDGRQSVEKSISLNKECLEGHITPLSLTVPGVRSTLRFSIGANNLGEAVEKFTITGNNGFSVSYAVNAENRYDYSVNGDSSTIFDQYEGQTFTATFESKNAIVSSTFIMPSNLGGGVNVIPALTVPYLLFEDFSCIHTSGSKDGDNSVGSDDRNQSGYSLDGYMDHKGWNAARFMVEKGTCPRINVRYQIVKLSIPFIGDMKFQSSHHGRLDTPQLTNLKSDAKVKLRVQFDAGGVEYNGDFSGQDIIGIALATHTNAAASIDGIPTGSAGITDQYETSLNDFGTTYFLQMMSSQYTTSSFGSTFPTLNAEVTDVTSQTRLCFYPITTLQIDGIGNDECAVYIDNIKVSIVK